MQAAITSTTLAVSLASNAKPLTAAPATIAALPKSDLLLSLIVMLLLEQLIFLV
jgi:hypothetical protein